MHIWVEPRVLDKLRFLRHPGESYCDVILRLAAAEGGAVLEIDSGNPRPPEPQGTRAPRPKSGLCQGPARCGSRAR
jgi:hypothetical protein